MKDFGQRLLQYRRKAGMSQEDLAEKVDVSRQTLSKWETGQSLPDAEKIQTVCEVLSITPNELLNYSSKVEKSHMKETEKRDAQNIIFDLFWLAMFVCGSLIFSVLFLTTTMPAWWVPIMALLMMLVPTVLFIVKGISRLIRKLKKRK